MEDSFSIEEVLDFQEAGSLKFPINLKLIKPVFVAEGQPELEFVTIHKEPTIDTLESLPMGNQTMGDFQPVVQKLIAQPKHLVKRLGIKDFNNILEVIQPFLS